MKLLIASDIHGSAYWCRKLIEVYNKEMPDKLLLLGDILYHGPRNDLPDEYDPKAVIAMLNPVAENILCVRGNCDAEVDDMVLDFPVLGEYAVVFDGEVSLYACHGHKDFPKVSCGDVIVSGHTHVAADYCENGIRYLNPGSVSIPKEDSGHGYIVYENGVFDRKIFE